MKLDINCVRSVLLATESMNYGEQLFFQAFFQKPQLEGYSEDTVQYTCLKLVEAGYIDAKVVRYIRQANRVTIIMDLTYNGHEFLNTIRSDKNWEKIKSTAKAAGVFSLKGLFEIGSTVAAAAITSALQQIL